MKYDITLKSIQAGTDFIPQEDIEYISKNIGKIQNIWEKHQRFRTETEMHVSVLQDAKHPTKASKYWQAARELSVMYQELVRLNFEFRRNEVEIKKLQKRIFEEKDELDRELLEIDLEEKLFTKVNMEATGLDRMREIKLWNGIMDNLDDGSFDTTDPNIHQLESFHLKFQKEVESLGSGASPSERLNAVGKNETVKRIVNNVKLELAQGKTNQKNLEYDEGVKFSGTVKVPTKVEIK